jgi:tetratricopeptide (TPR) repeat protein
MAEVKNQKSKIKNRASRRLWAFRIIVLLAAPILTLLLLELVLRLAGYGFSTAALIPCRIDGKAAYCDNFRFAWRFFPPALARQANAFAFPAVKADNTCRIFILGASAAAGTPDGSYSFGRILEAMLRRQYPQTDFQVITVAMPAINSHVVRLIAQDCARHRPDLFVVYMGNNEVVGPYGAGTVFGSLRSSLTLIRLSIAVKATRVGQLLTTALQAVSGAPRVWTGMQMFLGHQVAADDPRLETVYRHFQANLEDIRRLAQQQGIPLVLCTVASNLKDSPPFASRHRPDLTEVQKEQWQKLYDQGVAAEAANDWEGATKPYLDAAHIDDRYADLQFRLGRCYWQTGQFEKAKASFVLARELDTLRFRADSRINEIIRQVAERPPTKGVQLLDVVKLFEENSPHATPGAELFHEHVHMTFSGNYLLAKALLGRVEGMMEKGNNGTMGTQHSNGPVFQSSNPPVPTEAECAQDLAYTAWDRHRVTEEVLNAYIKQPPFTNQIDHLQRVAELERRIRQMQKAVSLQDTDTTYRQAIDRWPTDWWLRWNYGVFLERTGRSGDAARQYRQVCRLVPERFETIAKLGELSGEMGDLETAIARNREALRANPLFVDAWFNLGLAYHLQEKFALSAECYAKAIRYKPDHVQAYINLGVVLHQQNKTDQAIDVYRKALTLIPANVDLHCNLALLLAAQGRREEALRELAAARKLDPNSPKVQNARQAIR